MAGLQEVTDQDFDAEVLKADRPAIIDFWAEWCAPCRQISPIIGDLAQRYGDRVKVVKMNIDENPATPSRFGVRAIPTVLAFKGGQVVDQLTGSRPRAHFEEMVKKLLA
jgi:thioredoxin 1